MKLLIVTQKVDENDPILGFFCRWIEEFAKHVERIEIICLEEGEYHLPANVRVHSLGKEKGARNRVAYAARFVFLAWKLRHASDTVFVHMNPEYLALMGWWWRLSGKKTALWYTHKNVDAKLRIAERFADIIFTASRESFRLASKKVRVMGHGIDIEFFAPNADNAREKFLLSVGRLMKTKRHELAIDAAASVGAPLHIVGEGPLRLELERKAKEAGIEAFFLGGLPQKGVRDEYLKAHLFLHMSETGSLDKVILEALACGTPVVTTSSVFPEAPVVESKEDAASLHDAILAVQPYTAEDRVRYVRENHSLLRLVPKILSVYAERT